MQKVISLITLMSLTGCANTFSDIDNKYLVAGGAVIAAVAIARVEQNLEGNSFHTQASFVMGAAFTNIGGLSKMQAATACTLVGTVREVYKHKYKDVKFSWIDATINTASCAAGSNFRFTTSEHNTFTVNYKGVF